ncbi:MAG: hypothetical protein ACR2HG_05225 [Pyrinomonadaceae bacterium]
MNRKIRLNLIAACVLLLSSNLTAQQIKVTDKRADESVETVPARTLGQATLISGPTACSGGANCYNLDVSCPDVQETARFSLRVGNPDATVPARGTIIFLSGGDGTGAWDSSADSRRILGDLRSNGFRTAIIQWMTAGGWSKSAKGWHVGQGRLACRPATAARWVYDNLFTSTATTAFCATGQSGGSTQVAYMITQYGLADIISTAVLTGGPPHSRIDLGCLKYDSANSAAWYNDGASAGLIDEGFGYSTNFGPCTNNTFSFRKHFQEASIAYGDWQYNYPHTMVWFLIGAQDTTPAPGQSVFYQQRLLAAGTPFFRLNIVPNTGHGVPGSTEGANMIRDVMLNECHLR